MINIKRDGHVHSKYCPHGTKDSFEDYIEVALARGLEEITFTEHMPIPSGFMDDKFLSECSPSISQIEEYFSELRIIKNKFKDKIKINIGLEVDYIEGYEDYINCFLNKYGDIIEDSILSVHFVKCGDEYYCIDTIYYFERLLYKFGNLEKVYDIYYKTLLMAIKSNLGEYKPKRIGHPTLIRIFNQRYPIEYNNRIIFKEIIEELKKGNYELDLNTAGLRKELCKEVYPEKLFLKLAKDNGINMVYGSDAHRSLDVGKDFVEY